MTEEKKTPEAAPEPIVLTAAEFESLLVGCIWDILKRMRLVAMKEITVETATDEDDAVARHLARTLMGENDGFVLSIPLKGDALIEELQTRFPEEFGKDALPEEVEAANPRSVLVYVCRAYIQAVYHMVQELGMREDFDAEMLDREVKALAAFWANRFLGRGRETLN